MTNLLADPGRCPSCRSELPAGPATPLVCPGCHLDLRGDSGMRLFALLTEADQLIARIRARSAAPTAPVAAAASDRSAPSVPSVPAAATVGAAAAQRSGLRVAGVPGVLLGLGALCVLVAGSLFLPFAWDLLGVVGRTVVLLALTATSAVGARLAGARGLRATSESLGAVSLGLLALDVLGADASGWFGDVSEVQLLVLLGSVTVVAGTGQTLLVTRTPAGRHVSGEVAAVLGAAVAASGLAALSWGTLGQRLAVATAAVLLLAQGTRMLGAARPGSFDTAPVGHAALACLTWTGLALTGLVGLGAGLSVRAMWPDGAGLDLALAAVLVALPALHRGASQRVRVALLAVASVPAAVAVSAAAYDEGPTIRLLLALGALGLAVAGWRGLGRWRAVVAPLGVTGAGAAVLLLLPLAALALEAVGAAAVPLWAGAPGGAVSLRWDVVLWGPAWLLPTGVLGLALATALLVRVSGTVRTVLVATPTVLACAGALLVAGAPVAAAAALLLVPAVVAGVAALAAGERTWDLPVGVLAPAALVVAAYDELLTLVGAAVLVVLAVVRHLRGKGLVADIAGSAVVLLLTLATWAGLTMTQVPSVWTALVVLLAGSVTVVGRGLLRSDGRFGVEVGAVLAALPTVAAGVGSAGLEAEPRWLALYLTVLGVAVTTVALTRPDRRRAAWAGGLLLALASWVRLQDLGVGTVEAYTLPSALALLIVGWWHTVRTPGAGTLRTWSPGLALALVPSLLWSAADPLSWRALLLAVMCLALTVGGAQARLAAPLVWGAGVGAVLALWEVVPPALEASAWLVSGAAGAILLTLGASWDRRMREARDVAEYVRRLV